MIKKQGNQEKLFNEYI